MYLWRFAIEHYFRFLKQHLGLNANQSTDPVSTDQWMWLCALAYWQLLLMRDSVENVHSAWYPAQPAPNIRKKTPGQVQRGALRLLVKLGTPAKATRVQEKEKVAQKGIARRRDRVMRSSKRQNRPQNGFKTAHKLGFGLLHRLLRYKRPSGVCSTFLKSRTYAPYVLCPQGCTLYMCVWALRG
jgi:hypothetical protein